LRVGLTSHSVHACGVDFYFVEFFKNSTITLISGFR
jgi:hypothetical protein